MLRIARFSVPGIPRPGGSKKAFGRIIAQPGKKLRVATSVVDSSKHVKGWRALVQQRASALGLRRPEKGGEYALWLKFVMPRPQSHFNSKGLVKPGAPLRPLGRPDVLKLARAVEDALTGILWHDDAEITSEHLLKIYGTRPGVIVEVFKIK